MAVETIERDIRGVMILVRAFHEAIFVCLDFRFANVAYITFSLFFFEKKYYIQRFLIYLFFIRDKLFNNFFLLY